MRRFGVVGTGHWARWCHGTVLAAHPDVELVGFWGRDPAKAAAAAAECGGAAFDDLDALLAGVDAVSVAVPPDVQAPVAARALRAGRAVLLDKPLALDLAAADEVVAAARESGAATVSFMTYLFEASISGWLGRMRALADEHGPWEGATVTCAGSIDLPGSPYAASVWRRERGGLWDWGPHALSLVLSLLPPVRGVGATRGVRDTVTLGLEHEGGPGSTLTMTVTAPERAQAVAAVVWGPGGRHELPWPAPDLRQAYRDAVGGLRDAAATGRPHPLDVTYARGIVAVLAAAEGRLTAADRVAPVG